MRRDIMNAVKHADGVRYKIFREAQKIVHEADRLAGEMQDLGMDSREAMASAALTAGWRWWGVDNKEVLSQPETSERTDAADALLEILALRYNAPGGYSLSVGQMLADETHEVPLLGPVRHPAGGQRTMAGGEAPRAAGGDVTVKVGVG